MAEAYRSRPVCKTIFHRDVARRCRKCSPVTQLALTVTRGNPRPLGTVRDRLGKAAIACLRELTEVTKLRKDAIRDGNFAELKKLDSKLEQLFGAKERSFGAMWQHTNEHGC